MHLSLSLCGLILGLLACEKGFAHQLHSCPDCDEELENYAEYYYEENDNQDGTPKTIEKPIYHEACEDSYPPEDYITRGVDEFENTKMIPEHAETCENPWQDFETENVMDRLMVPEKEWVFERLEQCDEMKGLERNCRALNNGIYYYDPVYQYLLQLFNYMNPEYNAVHIPPSHTMSSMPMPVAAQCWDYDILMPVRQYVPVTGKVTLAATFTDFNWNGPMPAEMNKFNNYQRQTYFDNAGVNYMQVPNAGVNYMQVPNADVNYMQVPNAGVNYMQVPDPEVQFYGNTEVPLNVLLPASGKVTISAKFDDFTPLY